MNLVMHCFSRELDATLMQYKAMLNSEYSTIRALTVPMA